MAKKIILYLSAYNEKNRALISYECPNGGSVEGAQTNDAPVKYLLGKHPDISEILCLVTPEAEEKAWGHFQAVVQQARSEARCRRISIPKGKDFAQDILPEVLSMTEKGDEIFLETTGGFRDAVMYLLLISRALSYAGVKTAGAVYSHFGDRKITDAMPIIRLFDLIGGMQEAASFGNVRTLRAYYGSPAQDKSIEDLLSSMERLWETIALCRTEQLTSCVTQFNQAMAAAEKNADPLMRALLPAFSQKYGKQMTIPGVIKWCLESDMLQQALTIYKEHIPGYILTVRSHDILSITPRDYDELVQNCRKSSQQHQREEELCFNRFICLRSNRQGRTKEEFEELKKFHVNCSEAQMNKIIADYRRIRKLRNRVNHAGGTDPHEPIREEKGLRKSGHKSDVQVTAAEVEKAIRDALEHLRRCSRKASSP